jgi:DNA methylase/Restriction endonuclease
MIAGAFCTSTSLARKHDVIFSYTKSGSFTFNAQYYKSWQNNRYNYNPKYPEYYDEDEKKWYHLSLCRDVWEDLNPIGTENKERLGYPTQKPESLLQRIITASSNEGDVVLDAYCGCGTTIAVAQLLKRQWIGIDITYQSISLVLRRIEKAFGLAALKTITTDGIPRDMKSAEALAHKKDDRLRKEFEKWSVLTYTDNRAVINEKKGADAGIDARAYFLTGKNDNAKIIFQVKSGGVNRGDIATLRGDMEREKAALAVLITMEEPSGPMLKEAKAAGQYRHETMARSYDKISIVTIKEIVEEGKRLEIPMSLEVLAAAKRAVEDEQLGITF